MITKEIAVKAKIGEIFYHTSMHDSKKQPIKCRVSGKCQVWKTRPLEYSLPVKHGLYSSFYITHLNAINWRKEEDNEGVVSK